MQAELKKKGVTLLGFNCWDEAALARRFLRRVGATFPTILDSSPEAVRLSHQGYGVQGVPVHYLISHGWVVDSWLGAGRVHRRALEALEKLGIE